MGVGLGREETNRHLNFYSDPYLTGVATRTREPHILIHVSVNTEHIDPEWWSKEIRSSMRIQN